jgi:hypothetical protein
MKRRTFIKGMSAIAGAIAISPKIAFEFTKKTYKRATSIFFSEEEVELFEGILDGFEDQIVLSQLTMASFENGGIKWYLSS